jgi:protein-arginine kinase
MNPLSPNQILRNLENGYFMTHREQEEAAQYIRQLQQEVETLSVAKFHLESELDKTQDLLNDCLVEKHFRARGEK